MNKCHEEYKYPLIIPIVIYTGNRKWSVSTKYSTEVVKVLKNHIKGIDIEYKVIDINELEIDELLRINTNLTKAMALEKCKNPKELFECFNEIIKNATTDDELEDMKETLKYLYEKIEVKDLMNKNNINETDYSKTLEYVLLNNIYDEKYLKEYKDIKFNDASNFEEILTTFLPKGYTGKEINYIFKLSEKNINILKKLDYKDISNYYVIKNFNANNIERYDEYKKKNDINYKDVVTRVNIKLDLPVYTDTKEVEDGNDYLVLVNKYNHLPKNYRPTDLAYIPGAYGNNVPMRSITKDAFLELQDAAKKELNINLMPTTAFRDEAFQRTLYTNYVNKEGVDKADTYSARPGYSEHQTGLSIDLKNTALSNVRLSDENYDWLENNAYKYGFIIRFPKNKEDITLYQFENWHIRYVGRDAAKTIYENKLTLEEYIDLYVIEY